MNIFRQDFHPPQTFESEEVVVFPTDEVFYLSDHAAVMASQDSLRVWSQSEWPADSFTPEQIREDLLLHVADNNSHEAYGFMIYSPDRKRCLGSLYVNPLNGIPASYELRAEEAEALAQFDARLDFCGKHNIVCEIEKISAERVNEAYERVVKSDVRYRFVIDTATI